MTTTSKTVLIEIKIPAELKQYRQWVVWRYEKREKDKLTKVPCQVDGKNASSTDAATWNSYDAVIKAYSTGKYDGIGFVVTSTDKYCGIDLDHCRDAKTGEIEQWAKDIIMGLNSYAEITPSMQGVRVWIKAKMPADGRNRQGDIEIYEQGRYFTITGRHLENTPTVIEERQQELNQLHAKIFPPVQKENIGNGHKAPVGLADTELIQKAMAAHNGDNFSKLWKGDTSNYDGDDSRADLALCSMLAFWTGNNADRINKLFRQSGLYREKWERQDYRARTITAAVENNHEIYKSDIRENRTQTSDLPQIVVTHRPTKEITANSINALIAVNNPPTMFTRGAQSVRVCRDEHGIPFIEIMTEAAIRGRLDRAASFVKLIKDPNTEDQYKVIPTLVPRDVVQDLMTFPDFRLPALLSITEIPTLRANGSIITQPGYDAESSLFYAPDHGLIVPRIPENPSSKEISDAKNLILEVYCDFPYDTQSSMANMIAATATPIYRPMIDGPTPICIITKPQAGTGAGLSTEAMSTITTGRSAPMMGAPRDEEEWEKKLLSILRLGQVVIVIDNVDGVLYSSALSRFITAITVQGRILGTSNQITLPNRATWVANGNNISLGGDLPRRSYLVRMETSSDRAWERNIEFKHDPIIPWVKSNRGQIIAAYLTIAKAWIAAGKPLDNSLPRLGSFEDWRRIIGGILKYVGIDGFLGNVETVYQIADTESSKWEDFTEALGNTFTGDFIVADIVDLVFPKNKDKDAEITAAGQELLNSLPDAVDRDPRKFSKSLGHALTHKNNVHWHNGLMIFNTGEKRHSAMIWKINRWKDENQKGELANSQKDDLASKGELGELAQPPTHGECQSDIYSDTGETNYPNSPLGTKRGS